jgi:hypothetical protein
MNIDTVEKLLLLAFGWLLGILSPSVVEAIKRRKENSLVKVALAAELREVSYKLALANYSINAHFGALDRPFLHWFREVTSNYSGPNLVESSLPFVETQLGLTDVQFAEIVNIQTASKEKNLNLQKVIVPLLDARVSSVLYLDNSIQILLLDIRSNINLLNEIVDQARYYSGLTFGKLEGDNYEIVAGNLKDCQKQFALRAKRIIIKIQELSGLL